jgi:stage II sporulation protein D
MLAPAASAARRADATMLVIQGHGFGHGIGLSQWGAEKRAEAGQSYQQILSFYYPGTTLAPEPSRTVRVLVADRADLTIGSRSAFTASDQRGGTIHFAPGDYPVSPDGQIGAYHFAFPIAIDPGSSPVRVQGATYHGTVTLWHGEGDSVEAVNTLSLEQYVEDVVSAELPGYWRQGALRAQAVASRTYALANLRPGEPFDLYPDDRSQNYRGMGKEFASARAATLATAGTVLLYDGRVADAMFSASNGGLTSAVAPTWGGPFPYLVTRRDPYDARSPDLDWGPVRISVATLHDDFPQLPVPLLAVRLIHDDGDRVASLVFVGAAGKSVEIGGRDFQERLGLRSTFLTVVAAR